MAWHVESWPVGAWRGMVLCRVAWRGVEWRGVALNNDNNGYNYLC